MSETKQENINEFVTKMTSNNAGLQALGDLKAKAGSESSGMRNKLFQSEDNPECHPDREADQTPKMRQDRRAKQLQDKYRQTGWISLDEYQRKYTDANSISISSPFSVKHFNMSFDLNMVNMQESKSVDVEDKEVPVNFGDASKNMTNWPQEYLIKSSIQTITSGWQLVKSSLQNLVDKQKSATNKNANVDDEFVKEGAPVENRPRVISTNVTQLETVPSEVQQNITSIKDKTCHGTQRKRKITLAVYREMQRQQRKGTHSFESEFDKQLDLTSTKKLYLSYTCFEKCEKALLYEQSCHAFSNTCLRNNGLRLYDRFSNPLRHDLGLCQEDVKSFSYFNNVSSKETLKYSAFSRRNSYCRQLHTNVVRCRSQSLPDGSPKPTFVHTKNGWKLLNDNAVNVIPENEQSFVQTPHNARKLSTATSTISPIEIAYIRRKAEEALESSDQIDLVEKPCFGHLNVHIQFLIISEKLKVTIQNVQRTSGGDNSRSKCSYFVKVGQVSCQRRKGKQTKTFPMIDGKVTFDQVLYLKHATFENVHLITLKFQVFQENSRFGLKRSVCRAEAFVCLDDLDVVGSVSLQKVLNVK